ncbi:hypothetical protein GO003_019020 [Methylicorpusculum oleiharenae]|uniref:hypothetical protein n=1 Tax=Methylicorpusculum oleiharenae TaxID=1338687 RepID=UPI00135A0DB6|nr:hypothetical protein [Methylicorpusculum oleiharenae]MCD2452480.1 hypothetical protein [Methylicorpusculum oleiharenae]
MRTESYGCDGKVYGNKFWMIGKFDDDTGSSLKFFIAENHEVEKVVFFDGEKVACQNFTSKQDFSNIEELDASQISSLIWDLLEESLTDQTGAASNE